jgi:hypothetical protein
VRQQWPASCGNAGGPSMVAYQPSLPTRARSNTATSAHSRLSRAGSIAMYNENHMLPEPPATPSPPRTSSSRISIRGGQAATQADVDVNRPAMMRANTVSGLSDRMQGLATSSTIPSAAHPPPVTNVASLRGQLRSVGRPTAFKGDVFGDQDDDTASGSGSPDWGERSASPATSVGSLSRTASNAAIKANGVSNSGRKAPPPPPPSRSKKPPPPPPAKRIIS